MRAIAIFLLLLACSGFCAEPRPHDPDLVIEALFPPELIMQNAEAINLSSEQRDKLEAEMRKAHERFEELHAKLQQQREATAALLKKSRVDEPAAMAQFEKVLDQEREVRRAHLALMLSLKNQLTAEQQKQLEEIKSRSPKREIVERRTNPGKPPPASLRDKMEKLKAGIKKLEDAGGDASSIGEIMRELKPLMDEQRFKDAEEVVDQALKALQQQKR